MDDTTWIGDRFVSTRGRDVLVDLTRIGARLGASEGERRGHERVREEFEALGLRDVTLSSFDLPKWERGSSSVRLAGDREESLDCIALPGSPAATVEGEVVHLGYGLPEDFERADLDGTVVVARSDVPEYHDRWLHRREKYFRAVEGGAAAFVFQNHVEGCLPPTGSVGGGTDVVGPLPAVGVSKEVGEELRRYADGDDATARVSVDVDVADGTSQNVTGVVGPDTDEEILVCAHVDGHDISQGALDNASGVATVVEVAAALADIEDDLETAVRFVGFGAEELGLKGSQAYAEAANLASVKAVVNCDGAGRARDATVVTNGFDALGDAVSETSAALDRPLSAVPEVSTHSDHWPFVWRGVPGVQVRSVTGSGRGYGHTQADTLDKTDSRAIRSHGVLVADYVRRLAAADRELPGRDPADIRDELVAERQDVSMRVAGEWPFDDG
ncbi:MAG: M28 family peptidase [Haloferacaceae archaeon]